MNTTRKQAAALEALIALIAEGVEYPEAEWKASKQGTAIDCSTLRDLYDEHCAEQEEARLARRSQQAAEATAVEDFEIARLARAGIFI